MKNFQVWYLRTRLNNVQKMILNFQACLDPLQLPLAVDFLAKV